MIYIIRNADGTIKSFAQVGEDMILPPGETMELNPCSFVEYAQRFMLSCQGKSAQLVTAKIGDPPLTVQVECPGQASVDLDVNGTIETVTLTNGTGQIQLSTQVPGLFIIQPADRHTYATAGNGLLTVEVIP